jgi:hypothetical protein
LLGEEIVQRYLSAYLKGIENKPTCAAEKDLRPINTLKWYVQPVMAYVSDDKNYTDPSQSITANRPAERVGDITGQPATNEPTDRDRAAKLANLLEDLKFPATKEEIKNHINRRSPSVGNRSNDAFESVWNNLRDDIKYNSVYEIEKDAGLVKESQEGKQ